MRQEKILIIGNGFDLAVGLPTSYADFLNYSNMLLGIHKGVILTDNEKRVIHIDYPCEAADYYQCIQSTIQKTLLDEVYEEYHYITGNLEERLMEQYRTEGTQNNRLGEFRNLVKKNIWFNYLYGLYKRKQIKGENWIDFESEIAEVIRKVDDEHLSIDQRLDEIIGIEMIDKEKEGAKKDKLLFFAKCFEECFRLIKKTTVKQFIARLYNDLEKMITALGIYLSKIEHIFQKNTYICECVSKMMKNYLTNPDLCNISQIVFDHVMSFNYTGTFEILKHNALFKSKDNFVCYIHGRDFANMVLGIDEYNSQDIRSEKVDFSIFKKFVQRILKHTDVIYSSWIKQIESNRNRKSYQIHIFGHSLDVTDKDILNDFIRLDNTDVYIYAKDKVSEGNLVTNLLRIVDEDIVIRKSSSYPVRLRFVSSEP